MATHRVPEDLTCDTYPRMVGLSSDSLLILFVCSTVDNLARAVCMYPMVKSVSSCLRFA